MRLAVVVSVWSTSSSGACVQWKRSSAVERPDGDQHAPRRRTADPPVRLDPPCGSASSTTASTRTRSAEPSAGTATSPSGWPPTGHEVTYLTLRQWPEGDDAGVPGVRVVAVGPRHGAVRATAGGGSGRRSVFGLGVLLPPAAPRPALRRRAHRLVPVLLAARGGRCCAGAAGSGSSSTGTRSGRATTGASTSGRVGGRIGWRVQRLVPARPAAGVLLLAAPRAAAARGGLRGELTSCSRASTRAAGAPAPRPAEPVGRLRRPPHPGEAGRRRSCRRSRARARRSRSCAARSSATGRSGRRCCALIAAHGLEGRGRRAGLRRRRTVVERALRARRSASCCRRGARATGSSSSRRLRAALRASSSRGPTTPRPSSSTRA